MKGPERSSVLAVLVAVALAAACGSFGGSAVRPPATGLPPATAAPSGSYVPGEIVVKYRSDSTPRSLGSARVVRTAASAGGGFAVALVKVPEGREAEYISRYASQPNVEYAELNLVRTRVDGERVTVTGGNYGTQGERAQGAISPTDPKLSEFNAVFQVVKLDGTTVPASEATVQWDMHRIRVPATWSSVDGSGVKVAITDEGVDCTHPQLSGKCLEGYDAVDGRVISPGENSDTGGHGTHVAGTVAAKADGVDMVGVAPGVQIIPIRLLGPTGGTTFMVVTGMIKAADLGCRVFNASWGGFVGSRAELDAILYAIGKGCVPVFAAGNSFSPSNQPTYPASFAATVAGMFSVASSTPTDRVSTFSSSGRHVTVAAPGEPIYSLFPTAQGSAGYIRGTSMAAPHVTGVVALMLERNPSLTPAQVKTIVQNTARLPCSSYPKPDYSGGRCGTYNPGAGAYGWGIVDAAAAVQAAASP
jgi:subtilisin family serine protease